APGDAWRRVHADAVLPSRREWREPYHQSRQCGRRQVQDALLDDLKISEDRRAPSPWGGVGASDDAASHANLVRVASSSWSMSAQPLLKVENVSKSFGALAAVDDVSVEVRAGEILGVAGPNGAGKTTLFNLISGIPFAADRGRITFDGARIESMAPYRIFRLCLARTFQKEAAFPNLTVAQNVRMAATFGGHLRAGARVRAIDEALVLFDLSGERDRMASSLTVYATKRLMLASAVVNRPKLLMLDEPASGLNAAERSDVQRLILRLRD